MDLQKEQQGKLILDRVILLDRVLLEANHEYIELYYSRCKTDKFYTILNLIHSTMNDSRYSDIRGGLKEFENAFRIIFKNYHGAWINTNSPYQFSRALISFFITKALVSCINRSLYNYTTMGDSNEELHVNMLLGTEDFLLNLILDDLRNGFCFLHIKQGIELSLNESKGRMGIFRLLTILRTQPFVSSTKVTINYKQYGTLMLTNPIYVHIQSLPVYKTRFHIYKYRDEYVLYNDHFSSIRFYLRKNSFSGATFKDGQNTSETMLDMPLRVSKTKLIGILQNLTNEYTDGSVPLQTIDDLEKYLLSLLKELRYSNSLHDRTTSTFLSQRLAVVLNLLKIHYILLLPIFDQGVYFPFMFCFRGRVYTVSEMSYTFYKEFRFCLYAGHYSSNLEDDHLTHPLYSKFSPYLDKHIEIFSQMRMFPNLKTLPISIKRSMLLMLVSIGEPYKEKLGSRVKLGEFLEKALQVVNRCGRGDKLEELEFFDRIKVFHIYAIIDEVNRGIFIRGLLSKDATASCFQHLIRLLVNRNYEVLRGANFISPDTGYDTYVFILNQFEEKYKYNRLPENLQKYGTRSNLKKTIMTETYGAKEKTLENYFGSKIDTSKLNSLEQLVLTKHLQLFIQYLFKENQLFTVPSSKLLATFKHPSKLEIILGDKSLINLIYFKTKTIQLEFQRQNKRYTKQKQVLTPKIDGIKINLATRANIIQALDASIARQYTYATKMPTVHDCFFIDGYNLPFCVAKVNELMHQTAYNGDLADQTSLKNDLQNQFSLFIIL